MILFKSPKKYNYFSFALNTSWRPDSTRSLKLILKSWVCMESLCTNTHTNTHFVPPSLFTSVSCLLTGDVLKARWLVLLLLHRPTIKSGNTTNENLKEKSKKALPFTTHFLRVVHFLYTAVFSFTRWPTLIRNPPAHIVEWSFDSSDPVNRSAVAAAILKTGR